MVENRPVQTSAVYVLGQTPFPAIPPPSPPSPITPQATGLCTPIEELCLDESRPASPTGSSTGWNACDERLAGAIHVLSTEAAALNSLTQLYSKDPIARDGFHRAVEAITRTCKAHDGTGNGKLVIIGVGKSGHIAKKLVATFNSLAIQATFLHPTEALHGDLGQVGPSDTLLMITFSGKTPELLLLLPHLHKDHPLILLTSHTRPETCELIKHRSDIILLPAPIHESETVSFGVSAPTTSTTAALALGDAVALVASQELHPSVSAVFAKNHPGGAIGAAFKKPAGVAYLSVPWADIPVISPCTTQPAPSSASRITGADVLRAGYASHSGWVRVRDGVVSPSQIRRLASGDLALAVEELPWLVTSSCDFISISADASSAQAADMVRGIRDGPDEEQQCGGDSIIAVLEKGELRGVLEVGTFLAECA
ncbi:SIS domain-containing protein [Thozetella sp. PMI_491]|nr:SIS domain-containing protein [Thozetella sp. PMI_491]